MEENFFKFTCSSLIKEVAVLFCVTASSKIYQSLLQMLRGAVLFLVLTFTCISHGLSISSCF